MNTPKCSFGGMVFAVSRLVRDKKFVGSKVIQEMGFSNVSAVFLGTK